MDERRDRDQSEHSLGVALDITLQWRALFEFVDDGFCVIEKVETRPGEPLDFRYLEANQAFAREAGVGDVVGRTIRGAFPGESEEWFRLYDEILATGHARHLERELPTQGRILELYAFPLGDEKNRRLGVRFQDITERVRLRERDRLAMERLNLALDAARLGDWSWDARTDQVTFSSRAAEIFGVPAGTRMTFADRRRLLHPDDRERARQAVDTAIATKTDYGIEYRVMSQGGERWVCVSGRALYDEAGGVTGMFGVVQDITTDRLLVHVDDAVRPLTDPDEITFTAARLLGMHLRVNRCAYATVEDDENTFAVTGNYTSGTHSIVGRYTFRQFGAECLALMRAGEPYVATDSEHDARIDGVDREAYRSAAIRAVICVPILKSGRFLAAMAVHAVEPRVWSDTEVAQVQQVASRCWESIERARIERDRAQLLELAEQANRAKDEFLAMLGHELRNPLSPILTALQLMKLRGDTASQRERTVIERQVRHLTRLVDDLLDVSRIAQGKVKLNVELVEMADVVARAIEMSSPLFEEGSQTLAVDVPPGLTVSGDPARLAQIVSNLLTNASKYTPPGGRIDVTVAAEGDEIALRVRDTGIGMAPDVLPRVFELFVQGRQALDRSDGGLGLGLTIVKSLVDRHGGQVSATSDGPGLGSEFVVRLPAVRPIDHAPAAAASSPAAQEPPVTSPAVLLVVDDNPDAAQMLALGLRLLGHEVHVAHDGPAALRICADHTFDLAFLDIGLPVMDGFELASRLRELPGCRHARLIAVTGYGQASDRERTRAAGFDDHLVKPVDLDDVEQIVARHCARDRVG